MRRGRELNAGGSGREEVLVRVGQSECCFGEAAEAKRELRKAQKPWAKPSFDGIHFILGFWLGP